MPKMDLRFLIGKALTNDQFKDLLINNPEQAASQAGVTLPQAQMDALKKMTEDDWNKMETTIYDQQISTSTCEA